ncbi:putative leader peptide, partial [Streptomyces niveus]
ADHGHPFARGAATSGFRISPRAALSWTVVRSYRSWMYSRRHIDLLRVAGALCPAYGDAATRHTVPPRTAL